MPLPMARPTYRSPRRPVRAARTRNAWRRLLSAWTIDAQSALRTPTARVGQDLPVLPVACASLVHRTNTVPAEPRHATPRPTSALDVSPAATVRVRVRAAQAAYAQPCRARRIPFSAMEPATLRVRARRNRGKPASKLPIAQAGYPVWTVTAATVVARDPVRLVTSQTRSAPVRRCRTGRPPTRVTRLVTAQVFAREPAMD